MSIKLHLHKPNYYIIWSISPKNGVTWYCPRGPKYIEGSKQKLYGGDYPKLHNVLVHNFSKFDINSIAWKLVLKIYGLSATFVGPSSLTTKSSWLVDFLNLLINYLIMTRRITWIFNGPTNCSIAFLECLL